MISPVPGRGSLPFRAIALTISACFFAVSMAMAYDDGPAVAAPQKPKRKSQGLFSHRPENCGTLGYGPPGLYPGFQGFGLGYHPGYGYGGDARGTGAEGGYPFYGGPGYPHPWPCLNRLGPITPFPYYGGPGGPTPEQPHFFGWVGPLAPDEPVVTSEGGSPYAADYGPFTGTIPYPESTFASFTKPATGGADYEGPSPGAPSSTPMNSAPNPPSPTIPPPAPGAAARATDPGLLIGIVDESVTLSGGVRGLQVSRVLSRTVAEKAGLHAGDVIQSINGYVTSSQSDLAWIIANASPKKVLMMTVRTAGDGVVRIIAARLP